MKQEVTPPVVFRVARKPDGRQSYERVAEANATPSQVSQVPPAKSDGRRPGPRKTSQGGGSRFISRLVKTAESLRRRIAHLEREAVQVAEAAKKRTDAATRSVVEQRAAAETRTRRQTEAMEKRNNERKCVRDICLDFESGRIDAEEALRRINEQIVLGVPGLERCP
jgi:hypothetical protein